VLNAANNPDLVSIHQSALLILYLMVMIWLTPRTHSEHPLLSCYIGKHYQTHRVSKGLFTVIVYQFDHVISYYFERLCPQEQVGIGQEHVLLKYNLFIISTEQSVCLFSSLYQVELIDRSFGVS